MPVVVSHQFTEEADRKDGTKFRKYHLRSKVTVNGVYESFEHGKYFMEFADRPNSDSKGVLKAICAIDGVYSASANDYELAVKIGQMFDWDDDSIHETILKILSDKL